MEDYIRSVVQEMLAEIAPAGRAEFVGQFAMKIPTYIIADQLGVPREKFATFKRWSDAVIAESNPTNTQEQKKALTRTICGIAELCGGDCRRISPQPCRLHAERSCACGR